jgi:hypothetical protein
MEYLPHVQAFTQKWRYEVHADVSIDDRWVAHREFRHRGLSDWLIGELWEDTFQTFEQALAAAESWHIEREDDFDLEWIARESYLTGHPDCD